MEQALNEILVLHKNELLKENQLLVDQLKEKNQDQVENLTQQLAEQVALFKVEKQKWETERDQLVNKITDLKQYADVSMVKALSRSLESKKRENEHLTRLLGEKQKIEFKPKKNAAAEEQPAVTEEAVADEEEAEEEEEVAADEDAVAEEEEEVAADEEEEDEVELVFIELGDNQYYLDSVNNTLYEVVGDPDDGDVGEQLGELKTVMLRNKEYIWNDHSNKVYHTNEEGEILAEAGYIKNGKAVLKKQK